MREPSMNDFANIGDEEQRIEDNLIEDSLLFSDEDVTQFKTYNDNIKNIAEVYSTFEPATSHLLLRLFTKEIVQEEGLYRPNKTSVTIPTQAGYGAKQLIDDPFNFSRKAYVVAVGEGFSAYKTGDTVYLKDVVQAVPLASQGSIGITLKDQFVHPDSNLDEMPLDPTSEHFGYVIKRELDVIGKNKTSN